MIDPRPTVAGPPRPAPTAPFLDVTGLSRRFPTGGGVHGVSLSLARGEILALVGPSGSGKTTTLRLLAGFETPDTGTVRVEGEDVTRLAPVARRFGMVFQSYALFPHLDVGQNVAFGLEAQGVAAEDVARRVAATLALVDLGGFQRRRVTELSGGQQQRVALARALAPEPRVLFLDEPLSNLDSSLRERTRRELRDLIHRVGITTVLVTHEQEEAFDLGDRVALLHDGRLEQVGTPEALYGAPASLFAARFLGRGASIPASLSAWRDDGVLVRVEGAAWLLPREAAVHLTEGTTGPILLFARPEAVRLSTDEGIPARVVTRRFTGPATLYLVRTDGGAKLEVAGPPAAYGDGDVVRIVPSRRGEGGMHCFRVGDE